MSIRELIGRYTWIRFAIIGVAATIVHYGLYYLLMLAGVVYWAAYAAGYAVSLGFNLWATGRFTFRTRITPRKSILFLLSHAVNFVLHMSLLWVFVSAAGIDPRLAPVFVYMIVVPINFFLVRYSMKDKKL